MILKEARVIFLPKGSVGDCVRRRRELERGRERGECLDANHADLIVSGDTILVGVLLILVDTPPGTSVTCKRWAYQAALLRLWLPQ